VSTATVVKPGFFSNWRKAKRRSLSMANRISRRFSTSIDTRSGDRLPVVPNQNMVETGARDRIQILLHHVCHTPNGGNEVHNRRGMKDLVLSACQRWPTSVFAYGIWPSHGWDGRSGDCRCQD